MNLVAESQTPQLPIMLLITNVPTMTLELLRGVFATLTDIHLCESATDSPHVSDSSHNPAADVILIGTANIDFNCAAPARLEALLLQHPAAKLIALVEEPDYAATITLFRAGARGIICTSGLRFDLLCKSVRCVHQGQVWADNELLGHLVASLSRPKSSDLIDVQGRRLLTDREQQVLHLLAEGLSNHELAKELKLSAHTVKNHLFHIYDKLGVSNRTEAVLYALTPRKSRAAVLNNFGRQVDNIRMFRAS